MKSTFNYSLADSQATVVEPVASDEFPYDEYGVYEEERRERCRAFWAADSGVLVYRRMRVADCFSAGCADFRRSLELQLGALSASMAYPADVPNFLEPWYGIGTLASAFGAEYRWEPGQAPAVPSVYGSVRDAMKYPARLVRETGIGRSTLEMIDYFMAETGGRLPISLNDTQSPLNVAAMVVDVSTMLMECVDEPDLVRDFFMQIAGLQAEFVLDQQKLIGDSLVWPGHGFASSRDFSGLGQSDDNVLMMSNEMYEEIAAPSFCRCGERFGGVVFHSCGNWAAKLPVVLKLPGIRMVDGAFGSETDPAPNQPEPFAEAVAGTGVVLNARVVGKPDTVIEQVSRLWRPGMKLIVVTYCEPPDEQAEVYERIKAMCV